MNTPSDNFLKIPFTSDNLDRFYARTIILNSIKSSVKYFSGNLLDIGCGKMPYKEFILENSSVKKYTGLDIETALNYDTERKPDFTWNGFEMPFENEQFETALGTEVLEHCPKPEVILKEVTRVLKTGGVFFFTVPFLWPLHEVPNDEYRYTPFALNRLLAESGFDKIKICATGGWHASMAQMLGLWVRRSQLTEQKRRIFSLILKPIIRHLIKMDKCISTNFEEGQMITGLYGIAFKK